MNKECVRTWTVVVKALKLATAVLDYLTAIIKLIEAILSLFG